MIAKLDNFSEITKLPSVKSRIGDDIFSLFSKFKQGGKFAILVEVIDGDSMWTNVVEGMIAYSPEELKTLLDDAGFIHTEIYRMKPSYATIIGVKG